MRSCLAGHSGGCEMIGENIEFRPARVQALVKTPGPINAGIL